MTKLTWFTDPIKLGSEWKLQTTHRLQNDSRTCTMACTIMQMSSISGHASETYSWGDIILPIDDYCFGPWWSYFIGRYVKPVISGAVFQSIHFLEVFCFFVIFWLIIVESEVGVGVCIDICWYCRGVGVERVLSRLIMGLIILSAWSVMLIVGIWWLLERSWYSSLEVC